jgi:hypothetical protein
MEGGKMDVGIVLTILITLAIFMFGIFLLMLKGLRSDMINMDKRLLELLEKLADKVSWPDCKNFMKEAKEDIKERIKDYRSKNND